MNRRTFLKSALASLAALFGLKSRVKAETRTDAETAPAVYTVSCGRALLDGVLLAEGVVVTVRCAQNLYRYDEGRKTYVAAAPRYETTVTARTVVAPASAWVAFYEKHGDVVHTLLNGTLVVAARDEPDSGPVVRLPAAVLTRVSGSHECGGARVATDVDLISFGLPDGLPFSALYRGGRLGTAGLPITAGPTGCCTSTPLADR